MKHIDMKLHNFEKQNLVSLKNGKDQYKCKSCGCVGLRPGFVDFIVVTEKMFIKAKGCKYKPETKKVLRITVSGVHGLNLADGTYNVVACPEEYKHLAADVWIWHPDRKEPCRILPDEIDEKFFD